MALTKLSNWKEKNEKEKTREDLSLTTQITIAPNSA